MKVTRHNGRSGKHGTYNPKHNDRRFDISNSDHIDQEWAKQNVYWDCYQGFHFSTDQEQEDKIVYSFEQIERAYYHEHYPKDRPRQCVFAGTTNKVNFLPSDRTGNRRFLPISCSEKDAEVFILDDEKTSGEYIRQMWAEAMEIWRGGKVRLKLSKELENEVRQRQRRFMQEDVDSELILDFVLHFNDDQVCSKQLFREALHNEFSTPQKWQYNEINDIMNQLIRDGSLPGWKYFDSPRRFPGTDYGTQKGWGRIPDAVPEPKKDVNQQASPNNVNLG